MASCFHPINMDLVVRNPAIVVVAVMTDKMAVMAARD